MLFIFVSLIFLVGYILIFYYTDHIKTFSNEIKFMENFDSIKTCVQNVYITNYSDIHIENVNNVISNRSYRYENMYVKIKLGNTKVFNDSSDDFRKGYSINSIDNELNPIFYKFLHEIEQCSSNREYTIYFKDLTYYNNGIVDIPKLNIEFYEKIIANNYEKIDEIVFDKKLENYGKINIEDDLNEKFRVINSIVEEISVAITQYAFSNISNKEKNLFSMKNGVMNINNSILGFPVSPLSGNEENIYAKSNGGQVSFIQSNGLIYIDSYEKYCHNSNNLPFNDSVNSFKCDNHTSVGNPNTFEDDSDPYCETINKDLIDTDLFFPISFNEKDVSGNLMTGTELDFKNQLGKNHIYSLCKTYENHENSKVKLYLENILENSVDELSKKAFKNFYYYDNNVSSNSTYDINSWTDINEKKVFSINKGENGYVIHISKNKDFIQNKLNINTSSYFNPFYPREEFNFFLNNSGFDLFYKMLGKESFNSDIKILKTGNYIAIALPVMADVATNLINGTNYSLGDHVYIKFIEGTIIY